MFDFSFPCDKICPHSYVAFLDSKSRKKYSDLEIMEETFAIILSPADITESAVIGTNPYLTANGKKYSL